MSPADGDTAEFKLPDRCRKVKAFGRFPAHSPLNSTHCQPSPTCLRKKAAGDSHRLQAEPVACPRRLRGRFPSSVETPTRRFFVVLYSIREKPCFSAGFGITGIAFQQKVWAKMSPEAVGRPMEILLVEDDLEDAGATIDALRQGEIPCRVSLVRDGEEALEFLRRKGEYARAPRPDVLLLDLKLPRKSGREVLAEVKADPELSRIPVVVLTVSPTHEEVLRAEQLHVESYLTKPVDWRRFVAVVKSLRRYLLSDVILPQWGASEESGSPS